MLYSKLLYFILVILFIPLGLFSKDLPKCVYISSYHIGYSWSDEIEKSLKNVLKNECEIIQFNMDSKRNKNIDYIKEKALEAKNLIEKIKPQVVITSDDNAAKYVIKKYFNNSEIPFVFCGINWTAKEYNFSYKNTTGMIEITPIKELYNLAKSLTFGKKALFIGDDTITDKKDFSHFLNFANKNSITLDGALVNTLEDWKSAYKSAQEKYDFIILGHNSAIANWDEESIKKFLLKNSKKLVLTTYNWMMPYSMVGLIIKPQEQGFWAGNTAKAILGGFPISQIAITTNKTWNTSINLKLLERSNIKLPRQLMIKSKKYKMD